MFAVMFKNTLHAAGHNLVWLGMGSKTSGMSVHGHSMK